MRLDVRQLRYFLAVAEAGSLSRAAERLNLAQSAVSHHLADLEAKLGLQLLERHPRGIRLTPAGQRLHEHARSIVTAVAKAEEDVKAFAKEAMGPVSVGLPYTPTMIAALPFMRAVRREFPKVVLGLLEEQSELLVKRLFEGEIDLAALYNPPEDARLETIPILEEDLWFVGHPDVLGDREGSMEFPELLRFPLVLQYPSDASRALLESFLLRDQLPPRVMEFNSLSGVKHALVEGIGCCILSKASVQDKIDEGSIVARPIVNPKLSRRLHLASLRNRPRTRARDELASLLLNVINAEVKEGRWEARLIKS
jgi:LysR family transcriptional regulator, nitrogen assimilation regulatory protein